jgi:lipopolysaccharide transport system permease protein
MGVTGAMGEQITIIEPAGRWRGINVVELWRFRDLLWQLIWRDLRVRYKQTLLGAAWAVLQPAMMMVVFTLFFGGTGRVSSGGLPYPVFVYAGLVAWTFFGGAVSSAAASVVGSERLITKIYFPRLAIPFSAVGAAVIDVAIATSLLLGMMGWYGIAPGPRILLAPLILLMVGVMAAGVGTFLAALNVAYRDVRYVIPFMIQVWMFATPAVYTQGVGASAAARIWVAVNPMNGLVAGFRAMTLGGDVPWTGLGTGMLSGVILLLAGCLYFRRVEDGFADTI